MQSCHRCVVSFLCAHAMRLSMRWYIRTNTRTYTYAHKNARGPFSRYGQHVLGLNQDNTNMYVCVYIYIYDCPVRLCLFEKTRASEHTHSHVGTDLKKFIDLTLHCLLPHCRSLCILADPFYFYFCAKSLTVICVLLLFLNTSGILFFLCTGNVFCLFCFSTLLCLPSCFFGHFCLETYVRVTVFSCACAHALCDSHRSAWHWGLRELDFVWTTAWPAYSAFVSFRFFHVMIQCALDVVGACCIEWEINCSPTDRCTTVSTWRSSCQTCSDVLITLCLYTVDYG